MARYYGTITGAGTRDASRTGTPNSGLSARANGWNLGAAVTMHRNTLDEDLVTVYLTGGSNGAIPDVPVGTWRRTEQGFEKIR